MRSIKKEIISFLKGNQEFFINHFSYQYPLGEHLLEEFTHKWDWELLSCNEDLYWSLDLIERFEDYWHWESLSGNEKLPWSDELIVKYANKWTWNKINPWDFCLKDNNSIKWTHDILRKYPDRINWNMISADTELINNNPAILSDFPNRIDWESISGNEEINFTEDIIDRFESFWDWEYLSGNRAIDWTEELMNKYKSKFNFERYSEGNDEYWLNIKYTRTVGNESDGQKISEQVEPERTDSQKPQTNESKQADNTYMKLEIKDIFEVIESHKDNLDWESASLDMSIPWSIELIERYKERWEWGHKEESEEGTVIFKVGLTSNPKLPWSIELIRKFQDYWFWTDLSISESVPWSLELINEFYEKWNWSLLVSNQTLWKKVFYPFIDPPTIRKLLKT